MKNGYNIERLIGLLSCSHCGESFDESCIGLLEISYDTVMVRIVCKNCGKKYVLAFMDLNFSFFDAAFGMPLKADEVSERRERTEKEPIENSSNDDFDGVFTDEFDPGLYFSCKKETPKELDKITYDDVLEAHEFIQNFEENWRRYLDKRKYGIV